MQIILHTGAHFTEEDRLLKCLLRNRQDLSRQGVAIPGPGRYRSLLKDTFQALEAGTPSTEAREVLIDAILDQGTADRAILSNAHFFGSPRFAIGPDALYPLAPMRMRQFAGLFAPDPIEMFMAVRNPATLLPALLGKTSPAMLQEIFRGSHPRQLLWSETLARIREAVPDMPMTLWCAEDMPLIWADIIRVMAGLEAGRKITGGFDLLSSLITGDGMRLFRAYLNKHPNLDDAEKRQVIGNFLDEFALDGALEEELDLPGWTQDLVAELSEIYEDDLLRIAALPGVRMIAP